MCYDRPLWSNPRAGFRLALLTFQPNRNNLTYL